MMTTATMAAKFVLISLCVITVVEQVYAEDFYNSLSAADKELVNDVATEILKGSRTYKRTGKSGADPNFLRFGKRSNSEEFQLSGREPNFLRFGKRSEPAALNNNFLRFGRNAEPVATEFERDSRQPNHNFLRFG